MLGLLKVVILAIILGICTSIGILKAKTYDNRVLELKKMKNALEVLKSKIEFTYEPIKDIFLEISKIVYANEENIFKGTLKCMEQKRRNRKLEYGCGKKHKFRERGQRYH